jgi:tyrosyl-tRNA synthetase
MNFIEEMEWRGMLHDMTPGAKEATEKGMCTAYIGFDPTAPSLTIGNYVQVMVLNLWQRAGHKPVVLMGGATGRIGDPSGKDKERQLKSYEELDKNLNHQVKQMEKFLEFGEAGNGALLRNNLDYYKDMDVLSFLRKVGKSITINYMMSKDSVKNRLETGLSFTEFSYQLLQAYDFQCLYEQDNCTFQMGGSDQWGNITSGTEFIRKNVENAKAYAVTSKLLTKSDGKKFGKSEKGNLWMDAEMTTPYQFYQFWINADDADVKTFTRYFTLKDRSEIEQIENDLKGDERQQKSILAEELTTRIHGADTYKSVKDVSQILFNKKLDQETLRGMNKETLTMVSSELSQHDIAKDTLSGSVKLESLLTEHCNIFSSLSEIRRAIKANAVSVNKVKITDATAEVSTQDLLQDSYIMIENGKKNKYMLKFS